MLLAQSERYVRTHRDPSHQVGMARGNEVAGMVYVVDGACTRTECSCADTCPVDEFGAEAASRVASGSEGET